MGRHQQIIAVVSLGLAAACGGSEPPPAAPAPVPAAAEPAPAPAEPAPPAEPPAEPAAIKPAEPPVPAVTYDHGRMAWWEHRAKNQKESAKARAFYVQLFGWTEEEGKLGEAPVVFVKMGEDAPHAAFLVDPGLKGKAQWVGYISVADVDTAVASVASSGGSAVGEPVDVADFGRIAVVKDAQGAVFGLIKRTAGDPPWPKGAGHWAFFELWVKNKAARDAAIKLYAAAAGWGGHVVDRISPTYFDFTTGKQVRAGLELERKKGEAGAWFPFVKIENTDASTKAATKARAKIVAKPTSFGPVRTAVLRDPAGAKFALFERQPKKPEDTAKPATENTPPPP